MTSFGFGSGVTGGDGQPNTMTMIISTAEQLVAALTPLAQNVADRVPMVLELQTGIYNFTVQAPTREGQEFPIVARNVTIRGKANANVLIHGIRLALDLRSIDNILIENITFRSNGAKDFARDAITIDAPGPSEEGGSTVPFTEGREPSARVRITNCSFDGYFDIAIDSHSRRGFRAPRVTIDHCVFTDLHPGQDNFKNRGAINFSGAPKRAKRDVRGNASVTVAFNAFINVWRRSPRVVEGNVAHIFNNILYRWGAGNTTDDTWVGMAIGGGTGERRAGNGFAVIEANRFIPIAGKTELNHAIEIGAMAQVDLGTGNRANRFDDVNGNQLQDVIFPTPPALTTVTAASITSDSTNVVQNTSAVVWADVVQNAGPVGSGSLKTALLTLVTAKP